MAWADVVRVCVQVTLSLLSALATGFNCFIYSILTFYTPNDIVNKLAQDPLARLSDALPIAAGKTDQPDKSIHVCITAARRCLSVRPGLTRCSPSVNSGYVC